LRFLCFLGTVLEFHTWLIPIVAARDCNCNHQSCWFDSAKERSACIWSEASKDECTCWSKSKLIYLCTTMTNDWRISCLCFLGYASSARMLIINFSSSPDSQSRIFVVSGYHVVSDLMKCSKTLHNWEELLSSSYPSPDHQDMDFEGASLGFKGSSSLSNGTNLQSSP
jgi:hypothetical protein